MRLRKIFLGVLMAVVVVSLALGLAAARTSAAVVHPTTSQNDGPPAGGLSGGHYRLTSGQPAADQTSETLLMGGSYSLRSVRTVDLLPGCCCKSFLPCSFR